MNYLISALSDSGLKNDLDRLLVRASMVSVFLLFGSRDGRRRGEGANSLYQQRAAYFMDVFYVRHSGGAWFLGVMEWLICSLLFWNSRTRK
jgi:hypothetical protein